MITSWFKPHQHVCENMFQLYEACNHGTFFINVQKTWQQNKKWQEKKTLISYRAAQRQRLGETYVLSTMKTPKLMP